MAAILEAQSWRLAKKSRSSSALKMKWEEAETSIEAGLQILRNLVASGHKLHGEPEMLFANANLLRQSLGQTRVVARKAGALAPGSVPRAYAAAANYLQTVDYVFDEQTFEHYFTAIQQPVSFEMKELWQVQAFAQLALLESIATYADDLVAAKRAGQVATLPSKPQDQDSDEESGLSTLATLLVSLRRAKGADWNELFERINAIEQILRQDPCEAYAQMDFESRDNYRKTISDLAKRSKATEQDVARKALELAGVLHCSPNERIKALVEAVQPDRFHMTTNWFEFIMIGDNIYVKGAGMGWQKHAADAWNPFSFKELLSGGFLKGGEPAFVGTERIDGIDADVYDVTSIGDKNGAVRVWIGKSDGLPRKLNGRIGGVPMVAHFYDFNKDDISIKAPM